MNKSLLFDYWFAKDAASSKRASKKIRDALVRQPAKKEPTK